MDILFSFTTFKKHMSTNSFPVPCTACSPPWLRQSPLSSPKFGQNLRPIFTHPFLRACFPPWFDDTHMFKFLPRSLYSLFPPVTSAKPPKFSPSSPSFWQLYYPFLTHPLLRWKILPPPTNICRQEWREVCTKDDIYNFSGANELMPNCKKMKAEFS